MIVEGTSFIEDTERNINNVKEFSRDYSELFVRIEEVFGDDYEEFIHIYIYIKHKMIK